MADRDQRTLSGPHHGYDNVGWEDFHIREFETVHGPVTRDRVPCDMCGSDPLFAEGMTAVEIASR